MSNTTECMWVANLHGSHCLNSESQPGWDESGKHGVEATAFTLNGRRVLPISWHWTKPVWETLTVYLDDHRHQFVIAKFPYNLLIHKTGYFSTCDMTTKGSTTVLLYAFTSTHKLNMITIPKCEHYGLSPFQHLEHKNAIQANITKTVSSDTDPLDKWSMTSW